MHYRLKCIRRYALGKSYSHQHEYPADSDRESDQQAATWLEELRQKYAAAEPDDPPVIKPTMLLEILGNGKERIVWIKA